MKRLWNVIVLTLALNFLALAGGVGWLYYTGRVDREKILAIKDIVLPRPEEPKQEQAPDAPTTQPTLKLDELLARSIGMKASDQVQFIQSAFDAQMAELDRRRSEVSARQATVDVAMRQLAEDREKLAEAQKKLDEQVQARAKLESDQGFQDTLNLYISMPAKQVKTIMMGLDDETVIRYLQAMEPRQAAKITREFKSAEELKRVQKVIERMRQAQAATGE